MASIRERATRPLRSHKSEALLGEAKKLGWGKNSHEMRTLQNLLSDMRLKEAEAFIADFKSAADGQAILRRSLTHETEKVAKKLPQAELEFQKTAQRRSDAGAPKKNPDGKRSLSA